MQTLLKSIKAFYPDQKIAVLCAFVQGNPERWQGGLGELMPIAEQIILTSFHGEMDLPRTSVPAEEVSEFCRAKGYTDVVIADEPAEALKTLLEQPQEVLLVTGSFYLLNHIRPLLKDYL